MGINTFMLLTSLMWAQSGLGRDVDVNAITASGETLLTSAARRGYGSDVESLLSEGAQPNVSNARGFTPLHIVAGDWKPGGNYEGGVRKLELLLEAGADPELRDPHGDTALWRAVTVAGCPPYVETLLQHGANANAKNLEGQPLLSIAVTGSFPQSSGGWDMGSTIRTTIVSLLTRYGADVNERNQNHETPLHLIADLGITRQVLHNQKLMTLAAVGGGLESYYARQPGMQEVIEDQARSDNMRVVRLLLSRGSDVEAVDSEGRTPRKRAREAGEYEIARLLKKKKKRR